MADLRWVPGCGFLLGPDGDLADTALDPQAELLELVRTRIEAGEEGWQLYPDLGAGLASLPGRVASEEVLLLAERMVTRSLSGLLPAGSFTVSARGQAGRIELEILVSGNLAGVVVVDSAGVRFQTGG